ncbi:hypothetical protein HK104_010446 [Borealophlyctis nickersoniae]|nr:hypothetical protein HK104_010446 [Borealophlyctis nickersoniae]
MASYDPRPPSVAETNITMPDEPVTPHSITVPIIKGQEGFWTPRRKKIAACCGCTLVVAVIMIPLLILVIIPKYIQGILDGATISFKTINIANATDARFYLSAEALVENAGPFPATVHTPGIIKVSWVLDDGKEVPMATIPELPDIAISDGKGDLKAASSPVDVSDKTTIGKFVSYSVQAKKVVWRLQGEAEVTSFGITLKGLSMDKKVDFAGMEGLKNVSITSFNLPSDDPAGGIRVETTTSLNNPSPLAVDLSDVFFNASYAGSSVGVLSSRNFTLKRGENNLSLTGRLFPTQNTTTLAAVSTMFTNYITAKDTNLTVISVNSTSPASWLVQGFIGLPLNVVLKAPRPAPQLLSDIDLGPMEMTFSQNTPWGARVAAPQIRAKFKMPFGFPLSISRVKQSIDVLDSSQKTVIARLEAPEGEAQGNSADGNLRTGFSGGVLTTVGGQEAALSRLIRDLTTQNAINFPFRGTADVVAQTSVGPLSVTGLTFRDAPRVAGLAGLQKLDLGLADVRGGTRERGINMVLRTSINNPSLLTLNGLGTVGFFLKYRNELLSSVTLNDLSIKVSQTGTTTVNADSWGNPQSDSARLAGVDLLSRFVNGQNTPITIVGTRDSIGIACLKESMATVDIPAVFLGNPTKLLSGSNLYVGLLNALFTQTAEVTVSLINPFGATMSILQMQATISVQGRAISTIDADLRSSPARASPHSTGVSPRVKTKLLLSGTAIKALLDGLGNNLSVDVESTMVALMGEYEIPGLKYAQRGVPTVAKIEPSWNQW